MKKVKFTKGEQKVMKAFEGKEEIRWENGNFEQRALETLMFKQLIERKEGYGNVFLTTELGRKAIKWNKSAELLNGI